MVPGGKAILLIPTNWSHSRLYTKINVDPTTVENDITQILSKIPKNPTTGKVTEAFKDSDDILVTCFAVNTKGDTFHVKDINQLIHGQPIWRKTEVMLFPNFFYSDQTTTEQFLNNGFHIDKIENHFSEERRVAYNRTNPAIPLSSDYINYPLAMLYHVTKM